MFWKKVNENYSGVRRKIVILQDKDCLMWNITLLMHGTNVVNLKISAENGEILKESKENFMNI